MAHKMTFITRPLKVGGRESWLLLTVKGKNKAHGDDMTKSGFDSPWGIFFSKIWMRQGGAAAAAAVDQDGCRVKKCSHPKNTFLIKTASK